VPTWEELLEPDWACPTCGGFLWWEDLRGGRHCVDCEGRKLERSLALADRAARLRRTGRPARREAAPTAKAASPAGPRCDPAAAFDSLDAGGKRRSIRLGKVSQKTAEAVKVRIEHLAAAAETRHALDGETAQWVAELGDELAAKLARAGLVPERESATLGDFLQTYIDSRVDVKRGSRLNYRQTQESLLRVFGSKKPLRDITAADGDDFRLRLKAEGYAEATVRRRVKYARQFFLRWRCGRSWCLKIPLPR